MRALLLLALPILSTAQTITPNSGDIELSADIQMRISADQPGGNCWPGFSWHTTYGGCRQHSLETQTQTRSCGPGYIGQESRTNIRHNYILQATGQVANTPWQYGEWSTSGCKEEHPTPSLATSTRIAATPSGVNGLDYVRLHVMFDIPSETFWCYWQGGVWTPGPFEMQADGFADPNHTAWCITQPDGSMHYGHSYARSYVIRAQRRNASRVDIIATAGQMLNSCNCYVGGDSIPEFTPVGYVITP